MREIVFRVDSSTQIGSGHLMRCLTLANQLKTKAEIHFISRNLVGNLNYLIAQNGFKCIELLPANDRNNVLYGYEKWLTVKQEQDAKEVKEILKNLDTELLVVDSYAIDETWEKAIRSFVKKIMVIDDLANRKHECDILLDQNYYVDMNNRYKGLVSDKCKLLLGPTYALLREEFYIEKKKQRQRDGRIKNILVFFGGSDLTNETMKTLRALEMLNIEDITVNVVVGGSNQYKEEVKEFCQRYQWMNYYCQINNMAEMMNQADLAIGAGGTTTWERCFLGLPAIVIAVAENQVIGSRYCGEQHLIWYIGKFDEVSIDVLRQEIEELLVAQDRLNELIKHMIQIFGTCEKGESNFGFCIENW